MGSPLTYTLGVEGLLESTEHDANKKSNDNSEFESL